MSLSCFAVLLSSTLVIALSVPLRLLRDREVNDRRIDWAYCSIKRHGPLLHQGEQAQLVGHLPLLYTLSEPCHKLESARKYKWTLRVVWKGICIL